MEDINSKYIKWIYPKRFILIDNKDGLDIYPLNESVFENAKIHFNDNGSITLIGDMWQFGISFYDVYPEELDYTVHPNYISKTRFRKKDIVRSGWHRKLYDIYKEIIIKDYIIESSNG